MKLNLKKWLILLQSVLAVLLLTIPVQAADSAETVYQDEAALFQEGAWEAPEMVPADSGVRLFGMQPDFTKFLAEQLDAEAEVIDVSQFGINDPEVLKALYTKTINQNGDFFYVTGGFSYTKGYTNVIQKVWPKYDPELRGRRGEFQAKIDQVIRLVDNTMTTEEKILVLHDYLTEHTAYNWEVFHGRPTNNPNVYNAYGVLVQGDGVCQGYTMALSALLKQIGIPCDTATFPNHIWNMVQIDGEWYHIDVTWDDPVPDTRGTSRYNYFLLNDEQIGKNHTPLQLPDGITSTSTKYEDISWIFRQGDGRLFLYEHAIYRLEEYGREIYRYADLQSPGELLTDQMEGWKTFYAPGMVQTENFIYFMTSTQFSGNFPVHLQRLNLDTGTVKELETFDYTRTASADGVYSEDYDYLGMSLSSDGKSLEFWSSTRPESLLHSYVIRNDTELTGMKMQTDEVKITYFCAPADVGKAQLLTAFYQNGRMTGSRLQAIDRAGKGEALVPSGTGWDTVRAFLVDGERYEPLCPAEVLHMAG